MHLNMDIITHPEQHMGRADAADLSRLADAVLCARHMDDADRADGLVLRTWLTCAPQLCIQVTAEFGGRTYSPLLDEILILGNNGIGEEFMSLAAVEHSDLRRAVRAREYTVQWHTRDAITHCFCAKSVYLMFMAEPTSPKGCAQPKAPRRGSMLQFGAGAADNRETDNA